MYISCSLQCSTVCAREFIPHSLCIKSHWKRNCLTHLPNYLKTMRQPVHETKMYVALTVLRPDCIDSVLL